MVRSLWTAASGMLAQQTNVDTIANNLANVSTTGYKSQRNQFKTLLYQTLQTETTSANGTTKPTSAQVGLGVRNAAIQTIFTQGALEATESDTDFAIQGDGFFAIIDGQDNVSYTRNGNFFWGVNADDGLTLSTAEGYPVLDSTGVPISVTKAYQADQISFDSDGTLYYTDDDGDTTSLGKTIGLYQFPNPSGLEKEGGSLYQETAASGAVLNEATNTTVTKSTLTQGYLEGSNVEVADEMVNLITAQRAYELNSKAITTSDEMMQLANQLKS